MTPVVVVYVLAMALILGCWLKVFLELFTGGER